MYRHDSSHRITSIQPGSTSYNIHLVYVYLHKYKISSSCFSIIHIMIITVFIIWKSYHKSSHHKHASIRYCLAVTVYFSTLVWTALYI